MVHAEFAHIGFDWTNRMTVECAPSFVPIMMLQLCLFVDTYSDIYATVGPALMICQLLAVLEVIHPVLRWVRTGVIMPMLQVSLHTDNTLFPVDRVGFKRWQNSYYLTCGHT